jgi:phosphoglycolate phosphatase
MKYKLIIFDFDGTLADSFPWLLSIIDQFADKYGFKRIEKSEVETLRGLNASKMLQQHHVPFWKMPFIARDARNKMAQDIHQITLFEGIEQLLKSLSEKGVKLAMVSSNSIENIHKVLGPENAARIQYYECGVSIFGKSAKFKKILGKAGVKPGEALCIGDELRDLDAAERVGIAFGAVAWGYTAVEALQARAPREVFANIDEIMQKVA